MEHFSRCTSSALAQFFSSSFTRCSEPSIYFAPLSRIHLPHSSARASLEPATSRVQLSSRVMRRSIQINLDTGEIEGARADYNCGRGGKRIVPRVFRADHYKIRAKNNRAPRAGKFSPGENSLHSPRVDGEKTGLFLYLCFHFVLGCIFLFSLSLSLSLSTALLAFLQAIFPSFSRALVSFSFRPHANGYDVVVMHFSILLSPSHSRIPSL